MSDAPNVHTCLSQLTVERYLLGELEGAAREQVEAAIAGCDHCREAVEETRLDNEAFALRPVPAGIRELWADPPRRSPWLGRLLVAVPVAAAAALALVLFWPGAADDSIPGIGERGADELTRPKGLGRGTDGGAEVRDDLEPSLGFYVIGAQEHVLGRPGQKLGAGDRIQFWYDFQGTSDAVLVGIDGRGAVTRYFPDAAAAARLKPGRGGELELDDAVGVERFFLCLGDEAREPAKVERAASELVGSGADLKAITRLPLGCRQASVWIEKE
jgi:hypothetical protein